LHGRGMLESREVNKCREVGVRGRDGGFGVG
jgi:hypothetical protein